MKFDEILTKTANFKAQIVAVSKYVDAQAVGKLFDKGAINFGENRVQELAKKREILANLAINWHFIGNLQSNKINALIALRPKLWQSCNSAKLAKAVNSRLNYRLDTLLEINVANEPSKSGIDAKIAVETFLQIKSECKNLNLIGVMSIGAHTNEASKIEQSFKATRKIFETLKPHGAKICSMGMSDDYEIALENGSNMVRLGRILFG